MRLNITLYKNCILNKSYNQTFSFGSVDGAPTSVLELYLAMLENFNFDVNDVYYENSGELIFALEILIGSQRNNIYKYNYVKFVLYDNNNREILRRYCFVNSISVKNECVYLNYEEDIWHSYGSKIKGILPSYLSRSRVKEYDTKILNVVKLPRDYESNNKLNYKCIFVNSNSEINRQVYFFIELQLYELVSGSTDKQIRSSFFYLIAGEGASDKSNFIDEAYLLAEAFIANMPSLKIDNRNYQVGKIYIIPKYLITDISHLITNISYNINFPQGDGYTFGTLTAWSIDRGRLDLDKGYICKSGTLQNNYKNLKFGTMNNQIELTNNGTSFDYEIIFTRTFSSINLKLSVLNEIIDITEDFLYEPPISAILAEEFSQRKIAIELEQNRIAQQATRNSWGIVKSFDNAISNLGNVVLGAFSGSGKSAWNSGGGFRNDLLSIGEGIDTQTLLSKREKLIKSPIYSNTKGNITTTNKIFNYIGGLFLFTISPDNQEFVKNYVNIFGYEVYEFIFDLNEELLFAHNYYWRDHHINYNVIKFDSINVYGEFTNEIAEKLNNILMNGIRIWYEPTMSEDTYNDNLLN